jgi:hypothetical protein
MGGGSGASAVSLERVRVKTRGICSEAERLPWPDVDIERDMEDAIFAPIVRVVETVVAAAGSTPLEGDESITDFSTDHGVALAGRDTMRASSRDTMTGSSSSLTGLESRRQWVNERLKFRIALGMLGNVARRLFFFSDGFSVCGSLVGSGVSSKHRQARSQFRASKYLPRTTGTLRCCTGTNRPYRAPDPLMYVPVLSWKVYRPVSASYPVRTIPSGRR